MSIESTDNNEEVYLTVGSCDLSEDRAAQLVAENSGDLDQITKWAFDEFNFQIKEKKDSVKHSNFEDMAVLICHYISEKMGKPLNTGVIRNDVVDYSVTQGFHDGKKLWNVGTIYIMGVKVFNYRYSDEGELLLENFDKADLKEALRRFHDKLKYN